MILIIGGAYQGKLEYAMRMTGLERSDFADGSSCDPEAVYLAKGIFRFHEYIRRCLENGQDVSNLAERIAERNPGAVIVTDELGYGVVPVDAFDRQWRETTGRICTALAQRSWRVVRVVCGIGMTLKNDTENESDPARIDGGK